MNIEHILKATQMAVDIVGQSPHPDNKVAACAFTEHHAIARTNEWPERIEKNIGTSTRIGDSSGTIHAETNCLLHFPDKTDGASLAITDPCCPNCAKCIAEAGIKNIYIDHKGFTKDFASRRGDEFKNMSMSILVHAGINVYEVNRKEKTITPIHEHPENYIAQENNPLEIKPLHHKETPGNFLDILEAVHIKHPRWGAALAKDTTGQTFTLIASSHPAVGYLPATVKHDHSIETTNHKYDFYLEPLHRLLFGCARHALKITNGYLWTSTIPTARELVNLCATDLTILKIGQQTIPKKESAFSAQRQLEDANILKFKTLKLSDED